MLAGNARITQGHGQQHCQCATEDCGGRHQSTQGHEHQQLQEDHLEALAGKGDGGGGRSQVAFCRVPDNRVGVLEQAHGQRQRQQQSEQVGGGRQRHQGADGDYQQRIEVERVAEEGAQPVPERCDLGAGTQVAHGLTALGAERPAPGVDRRPACSGRSSESGTGRSAIWRDLRGGSGNRVSRGVQVLIRRMEAGSMMTDAGRRRS